MKKVPQFHRTRWLYRLTLLCGAAGGAAYYYGDQYLSGPNRETLMAFIIAAWALTTGVCFILATSDLWLKR